MICSVSNAIPRDNDEKREPTLDAGFEPITLLSHSHVPNVIVGTLFYSIISDKIQSRWQSSLAIGFTFIIGSAILNANPSADSAHFFAYYLLGLPMRHSSVVLLDGRRYEARFPAPGNHNWVYGLVRFCLCHLVAIDLLSCDGRAELQKGLYCQYR